MNNHLILRKTLSLSPSIIIELYNVREGLLVDVSGTWCHYQLMYTPDEYSTNSQCDDEYWPPLYYLWWH